MAEEQGTAPVTGTEDLPSKLPGVPESFLKKRKRVYDDQNVRARNALRHLHAKHYKGKITFKRAEKFIKDNRVKSRDELRLVRQSQHNKTNAVPADQKLAFVVRLHSGKQISPKVKRILSLLRLKTFNSGVLVELNKATLSMLQIVEPYITWGYPNLKSIRELVYKRGFAKVEGKRVPLTSNETIENQLGKVNIICTEDIIHELSTVGANFRHAANFLWPFKLDPPAGGWKKITTSFANGGEYGNRGDNINELLRRMV